MQMLLIFFIFFRLTFSFHMSIRDNHEPITEKTNCVNMNFMRIDLEDGTMECVKSRAPSTTGSATIHFTSLPSTTDSKLIPFSSCVSDHLSTSLQRARLFFWCPSSTTNSHSSSFRKGNWIQSSVSRICTASLRRASLLRCAPSARRPPVKRNCCVSLSASIRPRCDVVLGRRRTFPAARTALRCPLTSLHSTPKTSRTVAVKWTKLFKRFPAAVAVALPIKCTALAVPLVM